MTSLLVVIKPQHSLLRSEQQNTAQVAQSVECLRQGTGGHWFDLGLRHTKVIKNGSSGSLLGTQTYGVELGLVDPVSG